MPVQPTYPGVYIEEISSGVHTITGVATSITAFIGRALKGPEDEPVTIYSLSDYNRNFGGLWISSTMSYAVQDFFRNGGGQAIIIRIAQNAATAKVQFNINGSPPGTLTLLAKSSGSWGNSLKVKVDYDTASPTASPSSPLSSDTKFFNLSISEVDATTGKEKLLEKYLNVTLDDSEVNYLPRVLEQSSDLLTAEKDGTGKWVVSGVGPENTAKQLKTGSDGDDLLDSNYDNGNPDDKKGINALDKADLFNLLCIPPKTRGTDTTPAIYQAAMEICANRRAMLLVDSPVKWGSSAATAAKTAKDGLGSLGLSGTSARNAALFFPCVKVPDILRNNQIDTFVPCGMIAGIMAKTDTNRGVWKTPAGIDAALSGISGLQVNISDMENGSLNQIGINCLRTFPLAGSVVWGGRTLRGADFFGDDYKYIAVRRTALYLEESLYRGSKWVVFEPNDEPLWAQIRLNIGAFMHNLFRQGAFQGKTPKEAYLVKCDKETTTQNDINLGIVNILVGFAPLKPAEFVIIQIQQLAGQIES
jgi:phage tail sheath protein FI